MNNYDIDYDIDEAPTLDEIVASHQFTYPPSRINFNLIEGSVIDSAGEEWIYYPEDQRIRVRGDNDPDGGYYCASPSDMKKVLIRECYISLCIHCAKEITLSDGGNDQLCKYCRDILDSCSATSRDFEDMNSRAADIAEETAPIFKAQQWHWAMRTSFRVPDKDDIERVIKDSISSIEHNDLWYSGTGGFYCFKDGVITLCRDEVFISYNPEPQERSLPQKKEAIPGPNGWFI